MKFTHRLVRFESQTGEIQEFLGVYEKRNHSSLDEPDTQVEHLIAVIIGDDIIKLEGLGYFVHPETGITYQI
ncbi:MAG: hypothetical protein QM666_00915 [Acinetobacter sp.]